MPQRRPVAVGLVVLVLVVVSLVAAKSWWPRAQAPASWALERFAGQPPRFVVYYFYSGFRCRTCRRIEDTAQSLLEEHFRAPLDGGVLAWLPLNIDEPRYRHFHRDFEMPSRTLVLAEFAGQPPPRRYRRLDQAWSLAHRPERLAAYIREEVDAFLAGRAPPGDGAGTPRAGPP
ncbi:MAG: nitrophenyl compound nitroreductase subunit ArsF family protein [Acidobacteriota bacterium]|nr:nitrophenyl compound nitroreductase subunit ArsF family protein [Acidobacteriota bacterium]MDQ7086371.1 nitrophenyl compound nitroreductase subunit ArsF family protein [Acidobacteriota bacterium]